MGTRVTELRCKEVINISDGHRLGFVADVEVKLPDGQVVALVVPRAVPVFSACLAGRTIMWFPGTVFAAWARISSWWIWNRINAGSPAKTRWF